MYVPQGVRILGTQTQWTGKIASQVLTKQYLFQWASHCLVKYHVSLFVREAA